MGDLLTYDFMRHAFIAALLVGAAAPSVGVFLVQRRLSLIGDGLGHVALAGVAVGVLTGASPILTALIAAVLAAAVIELIRVKGSTNADIALAVMFYGGIAAGVVLLTKASNAGQVSINQYLFGSILTTSASDLWEFAALAVIAVGGTTVLRKRLFAVANDEEYARAVGLPVMPLNLLLSVLTSVTVVMSMRIIGLLLISALMILPNATAQLMARSFRATTVFAVVIGCLCGAAGVVTSFYSNTPSGGTVVLFAVALFIVAATASALVARARVRRSRRVEHHDHEHRAGCGHERIVHAGHVDYLHDGERHAAHEDHWDTHGSGGDAGLAGLATGSSSRRRSSTGSGASDVDDLAVRTESPVASRGEEDSERPAHCP